MRVRQLTKKSYYGGGYNKSKQLEYVSVTDLSCTKLNLHRLDAIKFPER